MLTPEQIDQNRDLFINLLQSVQIEGADIEGLIDWLNNSDFFFAPASTVFHNNCEGGLCAHCLNVYNNLVELVKKFKPADKEYTQDTLIIVALLHDLSKTDYYEKYAMNKKVYNEHGTKHDNLGNFEWVSEEAYKVKDVKDRFIGGEHGENSVYLINQFIPLTFEECLAVRHHHCGMGESKQLSDLSALMNKYPLITLLHIADMLATFIDERD